MLDPKEFMKKLKLIFYQLFNRKLPFVVFDRLTPVQGVEIFLPQWLFTNIKYETILAYDAKPDYFCSNVLISDQNFAEEFYQLFSILKSTPCLIQAVDFISALSKADDITRCSLNQVRDSMILSYPEKDRIVDKVVGIHLLDIDVEMYQKVYNSGKQPCCYPYSKTFKADDLKQDKFIIETYDGWPADGHVPRKVKIIIQVGLTVPSLPLFLKNYKPTYDKESECEITTGYDGDSVLVETSYSNALLTCRTTQPAQRWFVRREPSRKENQYVGESETNQTQEPDQETGTGEVVGREDSASQAAEAGRGTEEGSCSSDSCAACDHFCGRRKEGTGGV